MSVSPSKTAKAAGHDHDPATTAAAHVLTTKNLDPQLFMAARRGDYTQLKELLKLNDGDWNEEQATAEHITGAAAAAQVVVEVDDHRRRPAAASELLDLVTMEGDSLLHVVAACGDDEKFLRCAKLLFSRYKDLLSARNSKGDTPLHCAATAGNNNMVKCLVLLARGSETLEVKKLLKMPNECGETALHHAVRARRKDVVDQLMTEDPEQLACNDLIPSSEVSPLYLAVSLGEMEIARRLFIATSKTNKGKPSTYSGPHGRNVLHAAAISPGPGTHTYSSPLFFYYCRQSGYDPAVLL
jgi:ankyrin repeat protein